MANFWSIYSQIRLKGGAVSGIMAQDLGLSKEAWILDTQTES